MKLRETTAVTDLVGGSSPRIRGGHLKRDEALPAVAVVLAKKQPVNHAGGTTATRFTVVEAHCIAETYREARAVQTQVEIALNGYTNKGGTPAISMVHVTDITYAPDQAIPGQDKQFERFVLECLVQYSE